ncbi:MAG: PQ-loop domain-containing transporter [Acidimicrobiia bacterium]
MRSTFEILGMVGIGLSVVAYLPQVSHLTREHCSSGISTRAWSLWLASSFLVGALAVYRGDFVLISLAATSLLSSTAILILALRFRGRACDTHRHSLARPTEMITRNERRRSRLS